MDYAERKKMKYFSSKRTNIQSKLSVHRNKKGKAQKGTRKPRERVAWWKRKQQKKDERKNMRYVLLYNSVF